MADDADDSCVWNKRHFREDILKPAIKCIIKNLDLEMVMNTTKHLSLLGCNIAKNQLWSEVNILQAVTYKYHNQHRREKYFQGLERALKLIGRLNQLQLDTYLVGLSKQFPKLKKVTNIKVGESSFPSFVSVQSVLVLLQGAAKLASEIIKHLKTTFQHICAQLCLGFFVTFHIINAALASRLRFWSFQGCILLKSLCQSLCKGYEVLFPWVEVLKDGQQVEMPEILALPNCLETWLGAGDDINLTKNKESIIAAAAPFNPHPSSLLDKMFSVTPENKSSHSAFVEAEATPVVQPCYTMKDEIGEPVSTHDVSFLAARNEELPPGITSFSDPNGEGLSANYENHSGSLREQLSSCRTPERQILTYNDETTPCPSTLRNATNTSSTQQRVGETEKVDDRAALTVKRIMNLVKLKSPARSTARNRTIARFRQVNRNTNTYTGNKWKAQAIMNQLKEWNEKWRKRQKARLYVTGKIKCKNVKRKLKRLGVDFATVAPALPENDVEDENDVSSNEEEQELKQRDGKRKKKRKRKAKATELEKREAERGQHTEVAEPEGQSNLRVDGVEETEFVNTNSEGQNNKKMISNLEKGNANPAEISNVEVVTRTVSTNSNVEGAKIRETLRSPVDDTGERKFLMFDKEAVEEKVKGVFSSVTAKDQCWGNSENLDQDRRAESANPYVGIDRQMFVPVKDAGDFDQAYFLGNVRNSKNVAQPLHRGKGVSDDRAVWNNRLPIAFHDLANRSKEKSELPSRAGGPFDKGEHRAEGELTLEDFARIAKPRNRRKMKTNQRKKEMRKRIQNYLDSQAGAYSSVHAEGEGSPYGSHVSSNTPLTSDQTFLPLGQNSRQSERPKNSDDIDDIFNVLGL